MGTRGLTQGEIDLAKEIFGDAIDYAKVKIHDTQAHMLHPTGSAITPSGEIFAYGCCRQDFSTASPAQRAFFIHEMTHVWQYQNRILDPVKEALREAFRHGVNYFTGAYEYTLEKGKDLTAYGMEQQASIIEDYFLLYHENAPSLSKRLKNDGLGAGEQRALYEDVLAKFTNNPAYARKTPPPKRKPPGPGP